MLRLIPKARKTAVGALLVIALTPEILALAHWYRYYSPVLDTPVTLHRGSVQTPEFTVRTDGMQIAWFEFSRGLELNRDGCRLGMDGVFGRNCAGVPNLLDLHWAVLVNGNEAAAGPLVDWRRRFFYQDSVIRRPVAVFQAKAGTRCAIRVTFTNDPSDLNRNQPSVLVRSLDFHTQDFQLEDVLGLFWALSLFLP